MGGGGLFQKWLDWNLSHCEVKPFNCLERDSENAGILDKELQWASPQTCLAKNTEYKCELKPDIHVSYTIPAATNKWYSWYQTVCVHSLGAKTENCNERFWNIHILCSRQTCFDRLLVLEMMTNNWTLEISWDKLQQNCSVKCCKRFQILSHHPTFTIFHNSS